MPQYSPEMRLYDNYGKRLYLNAEERKRFLHAADDENREYRVLCSFFHYTGIRLSECLEVIPERILIDEGTVIIRTLKKRKYDMKGNLKKPQFRSIPVPEHLISDLDLVFDIRRTLRSKRGLKKPFWQVDSSNIYRMIKKVMKRANITGPQATPKGLRHGFGIAMAPHMPLNVLRDIMGHTATKTTEIYLQYVGDEKRELVLNAWENQ